MKILVVAPLLIALIGAANGFFMGKKKVGCCPPDQWQGNFGSQVGVSGHEPRFVASNTYIFYDATNSRLAANATVYENNKPKQYYIVIRNDQPCDDMKGNDCGKMYVIDHQTNKCHVTSRSFEKTCIPDDAWPMGTSTFGAGSDTIKAKNFMINKKGKGFNMSAWVTVTVQACIPFAVSSHGNVGQAGFMESGGYTNIKLSLDDPSVFDVPSQCKTPEDAEEFPDHIDYLRFSY